MNECQANFLTGSKYIWTVRTSLKILCLFVGAFQLPSAQGLWEDFDENQEDILKSSSSEIQLVESSSSFSSSIEISSSMASSSLEPSSSSSLQVEPSSSSQLIEEVSSSSNVVSSSSALVSSSSAQAQSSSSVVDVDTTEVSKEPVVLGGPRDIPPGASGPTPTIQELKAQSEPDPNVPKTGGPKAFEIPQKFGTGYRPDPQAEETLITPPKPEPLFPEKVKESASSEGASSSSKESLFKIPFQEDQSVRTQAPVTHIPLYKKEKGDYVSPRQAGFSSLALPGLGQFQIPGLSNKVRGSFYLITEVAIGFSIWYFGIEKQQEYIDKYKKNQREHFSILSFEEWAQGLSDAAGESNQTEEFGQRFDASRSSWCRSLYGSDTQGQNSCIERSSSHLQFVQNDRFSPDNDEAYYQFIGSEKWVAGWSDSQVDSYAAIVTKGEYQKMGSSKYQDQFNDARDQAEFYGSLRPWLITALVLNHLISAVDAAWAAESNNESLYEAPVQSSMSLNPKGEWVVSMSLGIQW